MLENGWVLNVDRDYARYCGAESWIDKKDIGDSEISDFIYEKDLGFEVAQEMTSSYECIEVVAELLEMIRNGDLRMKRELEKAEYKVAERHSEEFDKYMEERTR